jgi:hypothetical protein
VALAGDDQRVDDRRSLAGAGATDKKPVLFTNGGGPDAFSHRLLPILGQQLIRLKHPKKQAHTHDRRR